MSQNPQFSSTPKLLGAFAGFVGILSIFLYFTGWIYRWAYFGSFEIELIALNLPHESFLIVPIQVILGSWQNFLKSIVVFLITVGLIQVSLWFVRLSVTRRIRAIVNLFPQPFLDQIIIVGWILASLFWVARSQGIADAYRDALDSTSTRPLITLVTSKDKIALGRQLMNDPKDLPPDTNLNNDYRIFGDKDLFYQFKGTETNDHTRPDKPIIWRMLLETENWIYLFQSLPSNSPPDLRPPVLAIPAKDGRVQFLIRKPAQER
jgi:hypothetical protein